MIAPRTMFGRGLLLLAVGCVSGCANNDQDDVVAHIPEPALDGNTVDAGAPSGEAGTGSTFDAGPSTLDGETSVVEADSGSSGDDGGEPAGDYDPRDPVLVIPTKSSDSFPSEVLPANVSGDLLISQTGRGCLGVAGSAKPAVGSTLAIATCRGTEGQRWLVDGAVRLSEQPDLCLDADSKLKLSRCTGLTKTFALASDGVIERDTTAVDVTSSNEVVPYGTHRNENQRWSLLSKDLVFLETNKGHTVSYPMSAADTLGFQIEEARHRVGSVQPPYPLKAVRDVSKFPGAVSTGAPDVSRRVYLDRHFDHDTGYLRVSWPPQNWQNSGVYAPAGKTLVITLPDSAKAGLFVRLNTHTDALNASSSNVKDGTFKRMPSVSLRTALTPGVNLVRTPYGGEVVLESTRDTGELVPVEIHGGVEMPRFVLGVTSASEWQRRRALGAPWAELEGVRAAILVPSREIVNLAKPEEVMARYDRVADLEAKLSGLDASSGVHRLYAGKARFVEDVQITAGSGHSGFPIMATGWDMANQKTGGDSWGIWHELGHNHQQFCLWATRFGTETTVNVFSLYVQSVTQPGQSRIADQLDATIAGLESNTMHLDDADVWQKLVFLMQPVYAFPEVGFDMYKAVYRAYRELSEGERSAVCGSESLQVDTFYRFVSVAAGGDLYNHFARWGVAPSAAARKQVTDQGLKTPNVVVWRARP